MVGSLDDLQKLVRESENAHIELKREISKDVVKGLSTDIAALANYEGGHIVFGFSNSKEPVGCAYEDKDLDQISQQAGNCRPSIAINFEKISFGSQQFLVINVPKTSVLHSDTKNRFPIRIGNTTNYLDLSGILLHMRERGLIRGERPEVSQTPIQQERKPLPDSIASSIVRSLKSKNVALRIEALKDLHSLNQRHVLFEVEDIVTASESILNSGSDKEIDELLDTIRWGVLSGTPSELERIAPWMVRIREIGETADSAQVAQRAFDILLCAGNEEAVDLLVEWITETDDDRFSALNPSNLLANVRFYGLDSKIREAMHSLLESESRERVKNRIFVVSEAVRRAY